MAKGEPWQEDTVHAALEDLKAENTRLTVELAEAKHNCRIWSDIDECHREIEKHLKAALREARNWITDEKNAPFGYPCSLMDMINTALGEAPDDTP
jgi:hypothetical protein